MNLIAYFSHSGNTETIARYVHDHVGGELFRISAVKQYPSDYDAVVEVASVELHANARPELVQMVGSTEPYDVVYLGYPNWWSTMPMPVFTFLEQGDWAGKTIWPFCTHNGSSLGRSVQDIKRLCPRSTVLDGLAIRGSNAKSSKKTVLAWLDGPGRKKGT
jgi:flavodoxin